MRPRCLGCRDQGGATGLSDRTTNPNIKPRVAEASCSCSYRAESHSGVRVLSPAGSFSWSTCDGVRVA